MPVVGVVKLPVATSTSPWVIVIGHDVDVLPYVPVVKPAPRSTSLSLLPKFCMTSGEDTIVPSVVMVKPLFVASSLR